MDDNGWISRDPTWCSTCIEAKKPCDAHRGPDGQPVEYTGHDVYRPSPWVLNVVGHRYRAAFDGIYVCFGYDRRHGFWMRQVDAPYRETNISERAIDRTWHKIELSWGAWKLARAWLKLGRRPLTATECPDVDIAKATERLHNLGLVFHGVAGSYLTEDGKKIAAIENFHMIDTGETIAHLIESGVLEDCVHRAFGVVVNDLRLQAIRQRRKEAAEDIPIERLEKLVESFASGQEGHAPWYAPRMSPAEEDVKGSEVASGRSPERVRNLIASLAPRWSATVTGAVVHLTATVPLRA
jgi:hypothetical protein